MMLPASTRYPPTGMSRTAKSRDPRGGRLQSERLAQHLDGVSEPGHVLGCQLPIADLGGLRGDSVLDVAMMPQRPQRIGKGRRGRVVAGEHEDQQVVADVVVGERLAGFRVGGRDQRVNQRCVQVRIGTARLQHLTRHLAHRGDRGTGAAAGRGR